MTDSSPSLRGPGSPGDPAPGAPASRCAPSPRLRKDRSRERRPGTDQAEGGPQAPSSQPLTPPAAAASASLPRHPTQEVLDQAGRRGPFHYGDRVQVTDSKGRQHTFVLDPRGYFQSVRGSFHHREVVGLEEGSVIVTATGHELLLLRPLLADYVLSMPRGAQVVYAKDAAQVVALGDIFPGARVLEAGVGSGALTMSLLRAVGPQGHVLSVERREDFAAIAASNVDSWFGGHHPAWELRTGDFADVVAAHVTPATADRVVLDMLAPWENTEAVATALVPGGVLVTYVATVTQLSRTVEALRHSGLFTEPVSWESMVRTWNVDGLAVRPDHRMVAHTGFLVSARRLAAGSRPLTRKRPPARGAYDEGGYWVAQDIGERTSTDKKVRRVLRDARARQPLDATPVQPGAAGDDDVHGAEPPSRHCLSSRPVPDPHGAGA
ncbi:tRNA (adenine-N1)-methyltransferase [Actinomyces lilanjuaniae]|uniref:tRNA (adenine-N1)-methyltransferase n=1 Tax=Actinomyces lilanjuaniae TaxID=2321394 RepID=UPI001FAA0A08|nr:tRNA (adenine-N1)-methyltransferase [Actinomyces lilanjuaniae]